MSLSHADKELAEILSGMFDDPLGYVMFAFPWNEEPSIQKVEFAEPFRSRIKETYGVDYAYGPDKWACEFLEDLGAEIRARDFKHARNSVDPIRFSTASGHGIGKSVMVAFLIKFILDTRPFSMGVVTANTSDQLRTKTWAELGKWNSLSVTKHLWNYNNSRGNLSLSRVGGKEVSTRWRCDGLTAKAENAESFQGLHAADSTPFFIFDEASGIEDPIWEARFGAGTDGEPMSFDFGNPTRKTGYFFENTVGKYRHRYITRQIDSRSVAITNKKYFEELREDWGEDSDLFKVKVKGEFPNIGSVQFIPSDLVAEAMMRDARHDKNDPVYIGVDVARFGDNSTVICSRIGMDARSFKPKVFNRLDTVQVTEKIIETVKEFKALGKNVAGLFIDGGGLGAGPVDMLRRLGYNPIDVNFGKKAADRRYNRWGDQMWGYLRDALPRLAIPNDSELSAQLTQREYAINPNGAIALESKQMMLERGLASPDKADALALTFATTVNTTVRNLFNHQQNFAKHEYDPFSDDKEVDYGRTVRR